MSGQTAAIALNEQGRVQPKETVLITAAAGAAGIIAVQWAKLKGAHVIGTCSSPDKCKVLSELGCDRVINYNAEDVDKVLKSEYPKGIDVVFESVGGKMFQICVNHLAVRGRLIVIGSISTYQGSDFVKSVEQVSSFTLLMKSTTISGFFLPSYIDCIPGVVRELMLLLKNNAVTFPVDLIGSGLESVQAGIAYLYDRKNIGKVVVPLSPTVNL